MHLVNPSGDSRPNYESCDSPCGSPFTYESYEIPPGGSPSTCKDPPGVSPNPVNPPGGRCGLELAAL